MSFSDFQNSNNLLNEEQMKMITGGSENICCIAIRDSSGGWLGWSCGHSVGAAQFMYEGSFTFNSGNYVSGYCCASC